MSTAASIKELLNAEYFKWLYNLVCGKRYARKISFKKLLKHLHDMEFTWIVSMDENRAEDGISLRCRYSIAADIDYLDIRRYLNDPCSVLEMMVSLAIHMEECVMDDPDYGDRTGQWFWGMIVNLGLGHMTDEFYDPDYVDDAITRLLQREYEPDGRGGLFRLRHTDVDLRDVEIWYQMQWYCNDILDI